MPPGGVPNIPMGIPASRFPYRENGCACGIRIKGLRPSDEV